MYPLGIGGPYENFYPPAGCWCCSKAEGEQECFILRVH